MKQLKPIAGPYIDHKYTIVEAKKDPLKSRLETIRNDISNRYENYINLYNSDNLHSITNTPYNTDPDLSYLKKCYKGGTIPLGVLIKRIRDNQDLKQQGLCQYCCIHTPNSMDHYLPFDNFPEFSVMGLNLIPCCRDCNGIKHEYWIENGYRGIINFYRDTIPSEQFLQCSVSFDPGNIYPNIFYRLDIPSVIDPKKVELIKNHFKRLNLCKRYADASAKFISDKVISIKSYLNSIDPIEIRERIIKEGETLKREYGNNYWGGILTVELGNNTDFINNIINRY